MEDDIAERLSRIEEAQQVAGAALQAQGETLQVLVRHLAEIIGLLTPKESSGPHLDELLAHLVKQNSEQLRLIHDLVEALNRLEHELPAKVAAALRSTDGAGGARQ